MRPTLTPRSRCYDSGHHFKLHLLIIFQLVIDQSFKLIEKLHKIKKRFLKVVGVVSPLLLPLPTKTSSLSCEAFSISSKFDRSLVDANRDEHDVEAKEGGH